MKASELPGALRDSLSAFALVRKAKTLDGSATPAQLIDIAMRCPAIAPQQIDSEFLALAELVRKQDCRRILEIGTYKGGTLFVFSWLSRPDATIVSVDYHPTLFGRMCRMAQEPFFRKMIRRAQSLFLLREDSHAPRTVARAREVLRGRQVDLLFIDADHTYSGVRRDFEMYRPLVRPGGLVAFHDIVIEDVAKLWGEIKNDYAHSEFVHRPESGAYGIGVLWV